MRSRAWCPRLGVAIVVVSCLLACAVQTAAAQDQEERSDAVSQTPFWTKRKVVLLGGFGGSIAAGALAWSKEMELRDRKREMQGLPPGAIDEWNRQFSDATNLAGARNVWGVVAISAATVTSLYAMASRPRETRTPGLGPDVHPPGKPIWDLRVNPFLRSVSVDWSF